jgi:ATP-dependent Lon protease
VSESQFPIAVVEAPPGGLPAEMPILPVRHTVVYPYMPHQLTAGGARALRTLEAAAEDNGLLAIFAQKNLDAEEAGAADLYRTGTATKIHKLWRMPDGTVRLIIQGLARCGLGELVQEAPFLRGRILRLEDEGDLESTQVQALTRTVHRQFKAIVEMTPNMARELQIIATNIDHPGRLADFVVSNLDLALEEKQKLLELLDVPQRLEYLTGLLAREQEILEVGMKIQAQVQEKLGKSQREYYLREQLKHIQKELAGEDPQLAEGEELRAKVEESKLSPEAREAAERELRRLEQMNSSSPEYSMSRTYLDWLLALPWAVSTQDDLDLGAAARVLAEDHYGLEKVKDRILEFLAVRRLRQETKGPILCFVGPPGVGKTSLGRSIARALGRKFLRISLGGVHDEAEIRGHRRTYIGSMPGRIVQGLRKAGANNPVFMLDEIDKLGADFRGDPASALLEVLDPEQNNTFGDHYLDVPFDLSKVLFIATANLLGPVPPALRDRMEEIPIPGYTPDEKLQIARRHLLPRQVEGHGLRSGQLQLADEALARLIGEYTREAGLRQLERQLGALCRKAARRIVEGKRRRFKLKAGELEEYLGPAHFFAESKAGKGEVGVVTSLAATAVGGEILFIEATRMQGKEQLILTGQLGEVMRESARTALSYLRTRAGDWGVEPKALGEADIHIHVPAGATPKEGPSAGVALTLALVSLFTGRAVRSDVAMTGEITLRGRVLPVGGIRDKVLAAQRAGIRRVILPSRNANDLEEIPPPIRAQMRFELVERFDQVLELALLNGPRRKQVPPAARKKARAKGRPKASTKAGTRP